MMTREETEATKALYAAAEKAGMAGALRYCQVEVFLSGVHTGGPFAGKNFAYLGWEEELRECPEFVYPAAEMARAKKWLAAYATKKGWAVT
jgi:hypothetical protein